MRMRKKKNLIPRMERCSALWVREPEALRGRWLSRGAYGRLHLEIGCGKGKFTAQTARAAADVLLVGVERVPEAMVVAMERALAMELTNLLFLDMDAAHLGEVFAPGEVERIYLNFSDPWPGKRHAKRRLTSPGFLHLYKQLLKPGGEVHLKTDNVGLFDYSLEQFPACCYTLEQVTRDLHGAGVSGFMTDYEQKFHEAGTRISRCVARWDGGE